MIMKSQNGFGALQLILVLISVSLIGAAGLYVWQSQDKSTNNNSVNQPSGQTAQEQKEAVVVKSGTFTGLPPKTGSGSVGLVKNPDGTNTIRLNQDFKVQKGPALYVSFGSDGKVDHEAIFAELKGLEGQQDYVVPNNIDVSKYGQVFIYCKEFSVPFSVATLE